MTQARTPSRPRGRPRSEAGRQAILDTACRLLYEVGLQQMSMEEIARQSGVSKATLYRWWPSKTMVALDAYLENMSGKVIVPDTGSIREDFRRQIRSLIKFYTGKEGRVFCEFVAAAQHDKHFEVDFRDRFLAHRRTAVRAIWDRGAKRGEFRDDIDADTALDLIYSLVAYRLLTKRAELTADLADQIVSIAMDGLLRSTASTATAMPTRNALATRKLSLIDR